MEILRGIKGKILDLGKSWILEIKRVNSKIIED